MSNEIQIFNEEESTIPAILTSDKLLMIAEQAERRVEALKKIKLVALRMTNAKDWTDHQGKPWLQESGATKVARIFGISWKSNGEPQYEQFEDGHFQYSYSGTFTLADVSVEAVGSRQSKDGFFNTRHKWNKDKGKNEPFDVPPSEIDKGDVKKAAFANWLGRGITTVLGIKNLTWEEITEHTGIKKTDVTTIQYGKKTTEKQIDKKSTTNGQSTAGATQAQLNMIWAKSNNVNLVKDGDDTELRKVLSARYKKESTRDLDKTETKDFIDYLKTLEAMKTEEDVPH